MERFLAEVATQEWNEHQDTDRPFAEAVATLIAEHPHHAAHIQAHDERWEEMLGGAIDGTVEVLAELKERGVPLYALTNWSNEKFPIARRRFRFLDWFDGIVVSGEAKLMKPDPRIFLLLLGRYSLDAADCVYIDDSPRNVAVAAELGFHALHFTAPKALSGDLVRLGLI